MLLRVHPDSLNANCHDAQGDRQDSPWTPASRETVCWVGWSSTRGGHITPRPSNTAMRFRLLAARSRPPEFRAGRFRWSRAVPSKRPAITAERLARLSTAPMASMVVHIGRPAIDIAQVGRLEGILHDLDVGQTANRDCRQGRESTRAAGTDPSRPAALWRKYRPGRRFRAPVASPRREEETTGEHGNSSCSEEQIHDAAINRWHLICSGTAIGPP